MKLSLFGWVLFVAETGPVDHFSFNFDKVFKQFIHYNFFGNVERLFTILQNPLGRIGDIRKAGTIDCRAIFAYKCVMFSRSCLLQDLNFADQINWLIKEVV